MLFVVFVLASCFCDHLLSFPVLRLPLRIELPHGIQAKASFLLPSSVTAGLGFLLAQCYCGYMRDTLGHSLKTEIEPVVRPEKEPEQRRENVLRIRLTEDERAILDAASETGKTSTWARITLLRVAQSERKAGESNPSEKTDP